MAEVEQRNAECYASLETFTEQLHQLARDIESEPESVPHEIPPHEDDSLMQSVHDFKRTAKR